MAMAGGTGAALCFGGGKRGTSLSDTLWWREVPTLTCMLPHNIYMMSGRAFCHSSSLFSTAKKVIPCVLNAEPKAW